VPDYREAGHLPQRRSGGLPADPSGLPRQRRGVTPQMRGRYPDYDVLEERDHWDEVTRRVVLARIEEVPPIRFFGAAEAHTLGAFCDCVTAQESEPRIPLINFVDAKMFEGRLDGFQHAGMPDDREVWRMMAAVLDAEAARHGGQGSFGDCPQDVQHEICTRFADGELDTGPLDCSTAWSVMMRAVLSAFYSHPWAWNEIGFGGPAYPRGYSRFGSPHLPESERESWEGREAVSWNPGQMREGLG
jgi:Gluconate 2-dehydrogenase subunit 3